MSTRLCNHTNPLVAQRVYAAWQLAAFNNFFTTRFFVSTDTLPDFFISTCTLACNFFFVAFALYFAH